MNFLIRKLNGQTLDLCGTGSESNALANRPVVAHNPAHTIYFFFHGKTLTRSVWCLPSYVGVNQLNDVSQDLNQLAGIA